MVRIAMPDKLPALLVLALSLVCCVRAPGQPPGSEQAPRSESEKAGPSEAWAEVAWETHPEAECVPVSGVPHWLGSPSASAGTLLVGRADQTNRLNLFDHQSPLVSNRVWFGLRRLEQYNTGLTPPPAPEFVDENHIQNALLQAGLSPDIMSRQSLTLYRVGAEIVLGERASVTVQGQYLTLDGHGGPDTFTNPQMLGKYVFLQRPDLVLAGLLGYQPDVGTGFLTFNDRCHSLTPGMLFLCLSDHHPRGFVQGGFQFRIPLESNNVSTFDYVLAAGCWLWRHPSLDGSEGACFPGRRPWVVGLVPQIEVYGKHVINDATITDPFGLRPLLLGISDPPFFFNPFVYEEPRHVYDVTAGAKLLFSETSVLCGGISVPVTGSRVRNVEYILTLQIGF